MKMKMTAWACLLFVLAGACTGQMFSPEEAGEGTLSISIFDGDGIPTRVSDAAEYAYEKKVNNVQLFLFEGETLFRYTSVDTKNATFPYTQTWPSLKAGTYKVYAVANAAGLEHVTTEAELLATAVRLSDCGLTEDSGFIMAGSSSVTVAAASQTEIPLALHRFVSRIRLVSIENDVPATYAGGSSVEIKGVFLINALGQWNIGGSGAPSEWVNLAGRTAGRHDSASPEDYIVSAGQVHPAAYGAQVYRSVTESVPRGTTQQFPDCCLYSFPNPSVTDHTGNSVPASDGALTRLVVLAGVNGADWWYPVTLVHDGKGLERNTTYDVRLVLKGTGSSDPNEPVVHGSLQAALSVTGWTGSTEYTETI